MKANLMTCEKCKAHPVTLVEHNGKLVCWDCVDGHYRETAEVMEHFAQDITEELK